MPTRLTAILLAATALFAQKQPPPAPGAQRPFEFPKHQTRKLPNGLTVFVVEDHRLPVVSLTLTIPAGGVYVDVKKTGVASFTASLLREGTKTRTSQQIAQQVDQVGGNLNSYADDDNARATTSFLKANAGLGFELIADIVLNPVFSQEELDRQRRQALSGLQIQYSDPDFLAPVIAARSIYGLHPYGLPGNGTPTSIRGITRDDLVSFHQRFYGPEGSYLAVAGDITPAEAFAQAEKHFGAWKQNGQRPAAPEVKTENSRRVIVIDKPDAVQTRFLFVLRTIPRNHPDYLPMLIANQALGSGFNSRLMLKLRANEGLTYGASSQHNVQKLGGRLSATSFTRTEKTATAMNMMQGLIQELLDRPVTDEELREAKAFLTGNFAVAVETPEAVAGRIINAALFGLPDNYWSTYREQVQAVTREQVLAAVKRHVTPEKTLIVAAGNASGFAKDIEGLGKAEIIPFGDLDPLEPNLRRPAPSAPAATAATRGQGSQLVAAAMQALGGADALNKVKDISAKGAAKLSAPQGSFDGELQEIVLYPDKYRANITLPVARIVQVVDGSGGWIQQGPMNRDVPPAMAKQMALSIHTTAAIGLLREAAQGKAEVNAIDANSFTWKLGDHTVKVELDADRRPAKLTYRSVTPQGAMDVELRYSDYKQTGELMLPGKAVIVQNGSPFLDSTIAEWKVNSGVDASVFAKPAK
ncbi:MAG: insulinase family protein [Acidobacteria bacterium]|nr:insulinase family protein [Acidobacteriota bacterium]